MSHMLGKIRQVESDVSCWEALVLAPEVALLEFLKNLRFLDNLTAGTSLSLVHSDHQAMSHVIWVKAMRQDRQLNFVVFVQAARILANLIVMGSGILGRAVFQAYRQALANASKSGIAQETVQNIRRASKSMAEPEARQILGVTEHSSWEEILQKYDNLFEQNAKNGSFYLQSKVHRAKECLEAVYQKKAQGTMDA
ncbi:hypothetical protein POUND7_005539 [Theobroma cacao]